MNNIECLFSNMHLGDQLSYYDVPEVAQWIVTQKEKDYIKIETMSHNPFSYAYTKDQWNKGVAPSIVLFSSGRVKRYLEQLVNKSGTC